MSRHKSSTNHGVMQPAAEPRGPLTTITGRLLVAGWNDLAPLRRRDLVSAVNAVPRLSGLPASNAELTPGFLRRHVLQKSPAECGLSLSRLSTIRSDLGYMLDRAGVVERTRTPLAPVWKALLETVKEERRAGLVTLFRFASAREIAPEQVCTPMLADLLLHLTERTLTPYPSRLVGRARIAWNHACAHIANWPGHPLAALENRGCGILPLTAFPDSFRKDLAAFKRRLTATPLDEPDDNPASLEGRAAV